MSAAPRAAALFAILLVAGCTSLPSPSRNSVRLVSDPPGATATLSQGISSRTPCSASVHRRESFDVTFMLPGHETVTVPVRSIAGGSVSGATVMDGQVRVGLIDRPIGTDPPSAAAYEHTPNPHTARLAPLATTRPAQAR